jgi:hypothetical protein
MTFITILLKFLQLLQNILGGKYGHMSMNKMIPLTCLLFRNHVDKQSTKLFNYLKDMKFEQSYFYLFLPKLWI